MLLNVVFVTWNESESRSNYWNPQFKFCMSCIFYACRHICLSFCTIHPSEKRSAVKSLRIQGGLFLVSTTDNNRPPWIFRQIMQAPLIFFCCAPQLSLIWKKAPLIFLQHFWSPPEKKQAKLMPPWILNCKTKCPIHPKTAIFNRSIQGGLTHQKCYARVQPRHSVRCNMAGWPPTIHSHLTLTLCSPLQPERRTPGHIQVAIHPLTNKSKKVWSTFALFDIKRLLLTLIHVSQPKLGDISDLRLDIIIGQKCWLLSASFDSLKRIKWAGFHIWGESVWKQRLQYVSVEHRDHSARFVWDLWAQ